MNIDFTLFFHDISQAFDPLLSDVLLTVCSVNTDIFDCCEIIDLIKSVDLPVKASWKCVDIEQ